MRDKLWRQDYGFIFPELLMINWTAFVSNSHGQFLGVRKLLISYSFQGKKKGKGNKNKIK